MNACPDGIFLSWQEFNIAIANRAGQRCEVLGELLAERCEGNLLALDQELAKLALIRDDARVDQAAVLESVATSARFDVFRLGDAVLAGDIARATTVFDGLRSEGVQPPLVLWALVRELTLLSELSHASRQGGSLGEAMAKLRVWQSRQPLLRQALGRFSGNDLVRLMRQAAAVDRAVKGLDRMPPWESIGALMLGMLAPRRQRLPA